MARGNPAICQRQCLLRRLDAALLPGLARRALPSPVVAGGTRNFLLWKVVPAQKRIRGPAPQIRCPDYFSTRSWWPRGNDEAQMTNDERSPNDEPATRLSFVI